MFHTPVVMGAAKKLDEEITQYLVHLNDHQKKAVLAVVKTFAQDAEAATYSDDFKKDLDNRYEEFINGSELIDEAEANQRIKAIANGKPRK